MDRCGLADLVCAGSGWVGIRPGAVEVFPGQMLSAYRFQVKPGTEGHPLSRENQLRLLRGREACFTRAASVRIESAANL
jgi:hypothetical protein